MLLSATLLAACGGGTDDDSGEPLSLTITKVTDSHGHALDRDKSQAGYSTQSHQAWIGGGISTKDAIINWANSAGGSGSSTPQPTYCMDGVFQIQYACGWDWSISVPLSLGANTITMAATGDHKKPWEASITITREAGPPVICFGSICIGG